MSSVRRTGVQRSGVQGSGVKGLRGRLRRRAAVTGAGAVMLLVAAVPAGAAAAATGANGCPAAVPVDEIVAGQGATGLTVSVGTKPEPFTGTILGRIADGIAPGIDLVIAELDSPAMRAAGGVWAGMSGSPVYAEDGRLIGAVSYGLSVGPSLVGGLTPAASMRELLDGASPAALEPAVRVKVPDQLRAELVARGLATPDAAQAGFDQLELSLGISGGLRDIHRDEVVKRLNVPGARIYTAGQAGSTGGASADIVAGSNFAAALSYGDFTAAVMGTTTAVCDGEALAFGHPFLRSGPSSLSVHGAEAVYIQEDKTLSPFKVANPGPPVGTVDRDSIAGLHALLGSAPAAVQVTAKASLDGAERTGTTRVNVQELLPGLSLAAVLTNTDRLFDRFAGGRSTVDFTVRGTRAGGEGWTLRRSNVVADPFALSFASALGVPEAVDAVQTNRFEEVEVTDIDVVTDLNAVYRDYLVEEVAARVGSAPFEPVTADLPLTLQADSRLDLRVKLSPYKGRGPARTVELSLDIPAAAAGASGSLDITGGALGGGGFIEPGPGEPPGETPPSDTPPGTTSPTSFDELLTQLANAPHNDDVRATLTVASAEEGPGEPAPGEPAPGDPAPGDPAPGDPAPGDPAPPGPAAPLVSVQDVERVGDVVQGGLSIPVTVE